MKALLAFAIIGSIVMVFAGVFMWNLESQAGNTVAEAYYNYMGIAFIGLGIFCAMISGMIYHRQNLQGY